MSTSTIFYADDDEDDLMLFDDAVKIITKDTGLTVQLYLVENGVGLIDRIIEQKDPNPLVFLDLNMPFKSGFELLSEIRHHSKIKNTTVIIYSTSTDEATIEKSFKSGANFYVSKPNDFVSLKSMVDSLIRVDWKNQRPTPSKFVYENQPWVK